MSSNPDTATFDHITRDFRLVLGSQVQASPMIYEWNFLFTHSLMPPFNSCSDRVLVLVLPRPVLFRISLGNGLK